MAAVVSGKGIGAPIGSGSSSVKTSQNNSGQVVAVQTSSATVNAPANASQSQQVVTETPNNLLVHLGRLDLENLKFDIKPALSSDLPEGQSAPSLGAPDRPFGDLYMAGNTIYLSTRPLSVTDVDGVEYIDFSSNVIVGNTVITDQKLAFDANLRIDKLKDVDLTGLQDSYILQWNNSTQTWKPVAPVSYTHLTLPTKA